MRKLVPALVIAALALVPGRAEATEAGIDVGWVVVNGVVVDWVPTVDTLGVAWVRINFRLDAWNSPDDATPRGPDGLTWFAAYDRVIDAFIARGYQVYGLINDEAVASPAVHGSDPWIADYVTNAVQIVGHFKDRVRVYEVINEPNDFAGGTSARFTTRAFAKILQETYLAVKHHDGHAGDRCWQVDLVSGALFSFDDASSASYLADTYAIGTSQLAWDYTRAETGSFPLDGVGYHMYVAQGTDSSLADVQTTMHANLGAIRNVIAAREGDGNAKPLYVSEWGFRADVVGETGQADRLAAGFGALDSFGNVALGLYFSLQDFPDNEWGVLDSAGNRRASADRLAEVAATLRPARGAAVRSITAPTLVAGAVAEVVITLENRGAAPWTPGEFRLGAATGCPDAAATNELLWEPIAGYANGIADARVVLAAEVPPGGTVEIRVPVRAPEQPGSYQFAARMVHEGVAWFGATAAVPVTVMAAPSHDGDDDDPSGGCGCAMGGDGTSIVLALGLLGWLTRRRR